MNNDKQLDGLELLRSPFPPNQISKLPKGTKAQNQCDASEKQNCNICGGWHHPRIIHLDYVGHAALTDRLLDADPAWSWEPIAHSEQGLPLFDSSGGLWIKLTVCGVTRNGYGHAEASTYKDVGSREKEVIGDALRNAAMRFGAALDLWHKGDLHVEEPDLISKEQAQVIRAALAVSALEESDFLTRCGGGTIESIQTASYEGALKFIKSKGAENGTQAA